MRRFEPLARLASGVVVGLHHVRRQRRDQHSRLSEARRQLARILPNIRDERHDDMEPLTAERRAEASTILTAIPNCAPLKRVKARWADDMTMWWPSGRITTGLAALFETMQVNYDAGVTARLIGLVAGSGTTIWENAFVNPPDDPAHCPPHATWLLREKDGLVHEIRLLHASTGEVATNVQN